MFVKAIDADRWPHEAAMYRQEARVSAHLPTAVPAPRLIGTVGGADDTHGDRLVAGWFAMAFTDVDGSEPVQPWTRADLHRAVAVAVALVRDPVPAPSGLTHDHPRLGGWDHLASSPSCRSALAGQAPWAVAHLPELVSLEQAGLDAAQGRALVHFDLHPHNVLLTSDRVVLVDWAHARAGDPLVDLVTLLSSAAADRIDPQPYLTRYRIDAGDTAAVVDAILAAYAGFMMHGALSPVPAGLEPIAAAKLHFGLGALRWLRQRSTRFRPATGIRP